MIRDLKIKLKISYLNFLYRWKREKFKDKANRIFKLLNEIKQLSNEDNTYNRKVACIIEKHGLIKSYGFNYVYQGVEGKLAAPKRHAETHAYNSLSPKNRKIEKLNIWVSLEPCAACSTKLSENLDISKVIYFEKWPKLRGKGLSLLKEKCEVLNGNKVINK